MPRCASAAMATGAALLLCASAHAQFQRSFPATALRGDMVVQQPPAILLNGVAARLAPGARIRDRNNLLVMSGALVNTKLTVHYTLEHHGMLLDVWVLNNPEKARQPWPKNATEAQAWLFDPAAQTWSRP